MLFILLRLTNTCFDAAARFVCILAKPGRNFLEFDDFLPLVQVDASLLFYSTVSELIYTSAYGWMLEQLYRTSITSSTGRKICIGIMNRYRRRLGFSCICDIDLQSFQLITGDVRMMRQCPTMKVSIMASCQ